MHDFGYGAFRAGCNAAAVLLLCGNAAFAEPVVIAALGDSLTQGYGLPVNDGFVAQMQAWLDAEGANARLTNAGVSGDTTAGGLSRVAWTLTPDVDALIVALGANDYLRGISPELARSNISGILSEAAQQEVAVLLVGLEVGSNYGPDYKAAFDSLYPELAEDYDTLYFRTWFQGLEGQGAVFGNRDYFQPDGIHPNAEGVNLIVDAMGPAVVELIERVQETAAATN